MYGFIDRLILSHGLIIRSREPIDLLSSFSEKFLLLIDHVHKL